MALWKVDEGRLAQVSEISFTDAKVLEERIEDWVAENPGVLGEPLLPIGRQVRVADVGDTLDLLALDPDGNAVVIELKRGRLTDPVDMQALRYASYIAEWDFDALEAVAREYLGGRTDADFNLNERLEPAPVSRTPRLW